MVGTLPLSGAACAGGRAATQSLCVQAVGSGLSCLATLVSDKERIRGVYTTMRYNNRQPLPLFYLYPYLPTAPHVPWTF